MPTCHLILSPTWEVSRKDSHLIEEDTKTQGGHREGREGRPGERDQDVQPTSAWPVSAQTPGFFATNILGEPFSKWEKEPTLGGCWPWFPAVQPSEPLFKCLGQGERQLCRQKGREIGSYRERGSRGPVLWARDSMAAEHTGPGKPGPVQTSSCGVWEEGKTSSRRAGDICCALLGSTWPDCGGWTARRLTAGRQSGGGWTRLRPEGGRRAGGSGAKTHIRGGLGRTWGPDRKWARGSRNH